MYKEKFVEYICEVNEDLFEQIDLDKVKYDTFNPFFRYYKFEIIKKAISKYKEEFIDKEYLRNWFLAYNRLLNGDFDEKANHSFNEVVDFIRNEITWQLDSLSLFDESEDLDEYINIFETLDYICKTESKWVIYYSVNEDEDIDEQYILLVNEKEKKFIEIITDFFENGDETDRLVCLSNRDYKNKIRLLESLNYKELEY